MNQICVNKVNHYHIVLSSCSNHKISSNRQATEFFSHPIPMDSGQNLGVPDYQVSVANFKINHIIPALLEFLKT